MGSMGVQLEQVSIRYPGADPSRAAVDGVSLGLAQGQIGVLIGPSGCGKTTVLRAIAGLERLAGGKVTVAGQPVSDAARGLHAAPESRRIGMVFQDYALFPHLNVAANVAFGLRVKKETIGEITAAAQVMREFSTKVVVEDRRHLVDIVGTGGDSSHTFNISTCSMFVAAACGARVSKHGNRSVSSKSGSADVLEALGAALALSPASIAQCIADTGIGFMFAPHHHPAMKNVAPVRKELGVRTIFNILGPLTNPADAPNILLGVFHPDLVGIQVRALQRLGVEHALVVYGRDGMDEVSLGAATLVGELKDNTVREYEIHPEDYGLTMASNRTLKVDTPERSKVLLQSVLDDEPGPARDIVILNAGAALYAANVAMTVNDGIAMAREAIATGKALAKMHQFIARTKELASA